MHDELKRQVGHLRTLESANGRLQRAVEALKSDAAAAGPLREQVRSLENRLRLAEPLRTGLFRAQAELDNLRRQRDEWLAFLDEEDATDPTPKTVSRALAAARLEVVGLRERLGLRDVDVHHRDGVIAQLEDRLAELEGADAAVQQRVRQLEDGLARESRFATLSMRECEILRDELVRPHLPPIPLTPAESD